jgi:hypothetical protein
VNGWPLVLGFIITALAMFAGVYRAKTENAAIRNGVLCLVIGLVALWASYAFGYRPGA